MGETFARYATEEQKARVKWTENAAVASTAASYAAMALSEASGLSYATLTYEASHVVGMIEQRRQDAIQKLLQALELIGYDK